MKETRTKVKTLETYFFNIQYLGSLQRYNT
jgi:hypothetical protein